MAPPAQSLTSGSCESPALTTTSTRQIAILYANDCLRINRDGQWAKRLNSSDLVRAEAKLGANPNPAIAWPTAPEQNTGISKKTWIWIAVAAVATGAAYAILSEQSRETRTIVRPVSREGG